MTAVEERPSRCAILGAGLVHPRVDHWRGLADWIRSAEAGAEPPARDEGPLDFGPAPVGASRASEHEGTSSRRAGHHDEVAGPRARRLMAKPTLLAHIAMRRALRDAWPSGDRTRVGYAFAVGGGGGPISELGTLLAASLDDGRVCLERFAAQGLRATHPLMAFQLLNNYVHCHPAILESLGGSNLGLFSRGAGTVHALDDATWRLEERACDLVVAGGADAARYPATWLALRDRGAMAEGMLPTDAAAALVLATGVEPRCGAPSHGAREGVDADALRPLGWLLAARVDDAGGPTPGDFPRPRHPTRDAARARARLDALVAGLDLGSLHAVVLAAWSPVAQSLLASWAADRCRAERLAATEALGDALAATPALATLAALDAVVGTDRSALAMGIDVDGAGWAVAVRGGA